MSKYKDLKKDMRTISFDSLNVLSVAALYDLKNNPTCYCNTEGHTPPCFSCQVVKALDEAGLMKAPPLTIHTGQKKVIHD